MKHLAILAAASLAVLAAFVCPAQDAAAAKIDAKAAEVALPAPAKTGGMPLMQALAERKTVRDYKPGEELDAATLSEILYAANGVNRPDGKRTIPTAMNKQDLEVYVALPDAVYHYDAKANKLVKIDDGDFRPDLIMNKNMAKNSACILVYASDSTKFPDDIKYPAIHVGEASQDVYLYCASKGLGTVSLGMYDEKAVRKVFKLEDKMTVILAQAVGIPAK